MTAAALPAVAVFATAQSPVPWVRLTDSSNSEQGSGYNIKMFWARPNAAPNEDPLEGYDVSGVNKTSSNKTPVYFSDKPFAPDATSASKQFRQSELQHGSLYAFSAVPYHYDDIGTPTRPNIQKRTPADNPFAFYLTDIDVEASGYIESSGGINSTYVTVTWDNPAYDGVSVIKQFDIYYAPVSENEEIPMDERTKVAVRVDNNDPKLETLSDGKLRYTFRAPGNVEPLKPYQLKVVPNFDNNVVTVGGTDYPAVDIGNNNDKAVVFSGREYRCSFIIEPQVTVHKYGADKIIIQWSDLSAFETSSGSGGSSGDEIKIASVVIYERSKTDPIPKIIGTLYGLAAKDINFWITDDPEKTPPYERKEYTIDVYYTINGKQADPPLRPDWASVLDGDEEYLPYLPTIYELKANEKQGDGKTEYSVDMRWLAFQRDPYYPQSEPLNWDSDGDGKNDGFIDNQLVYNIWVTDDASNFDIDAFQTFALRLGDENSTELPTANLDVKNYPETFVDTDGQTKTRIKPTYVLREEDGKAIKEYAARSASGGFEYKPLEPNKVYYFRIVAKRVPLTNPPKQSRPGRGSIFIPGTGAAERPLMISAPPLRIQRDEKGLEKITDTTVAIEWDTRFVEAYDAKTNRWYSQALLGKDENGNAAPVFGGSPSDENILLGVKPEKDTNQMLTKARAALSSKLGGNTTPSAEDIPLRVIDLGALPSEPDSKAAAPAAGRYANYAVHTAEDSAISSDYNNYVTGALAGDAVWRRDVAPQKEGAYTLSYVVDKTENPGGELKPNTPYVIFLLPYYDNQKDAYYPAYITATTIEARPPLDIDPTTPVIRVDTSKTTDQDITVYWTYQEGMEYILHYSELASDHSGNGGVAIPWDELKPPNSTIIKDRKDPETGRVQPFIEYTVKYLFPETAYHFWVEVRPAGSEGGGDKDKAKISNPVSETTKEMQPPDPPRGFGIAGKESVGLHNKIFGTEWDGSDPKSLILEWMMDLNDTVYPEESKGGGEKADPAADLYPLVMAYFPDLTPNKRYYARAKTVLTIVKGEPGKPYTPVYNYVVQVSADPDFVDYVEKIIPDLKPETVDNVSAKRKESAWTSTINVTTGKSGDDYDTNVNPNHYPLPTKDFEIIYDAAAQTLTYRMRSNKKDQQGNNDNQVDQRFISNMIKQGAFTYDADLSQYSGRALKERRFEMPYSIYRAFDERKISLNIKMDDFGLTIAPGSLNTPEAKAVPNFGASSYISVRVTENPPAHALEAGQRYAAAPRKIGVTIEADMNTANLKTLAQPMSLEFKAPAAKDGENTGVYVSDTNTGGWSRLNADYSPKEKSYAASSPKLSNFAVIARPAPASTGDEYTDYTLKNLTSRVDITDLPRIDPAAPIDGGQLNALIYAVSKNLRTAAVNAPLPKDAADALAKAGMSVPVGEVPKLQGVKALVRLYETKAGQIKDYGSVSDYPEADGQDKAAKTAILKAEAVGLLDRTPSLSGNLTYADALYMIDLAIQDGGN
jgi:hypothetical protein